jgi:hypothetical protein
MGSYTEAPHSSPVRTTEVVEGLISTVMRFRSWFSTWARGHGLYTMVNKTALISQWAPQATVHATKLNRPTCWVSDGTHLHSYGTHRFRATPSQRLLKETTQTTRVCAIAAPSVGSHCLPAFPNVSFLDGHFFHLSGRDVMSVSSEGGDQTGCDENVTSALFLMVDPVGQE